MVDTAITGMFGRNTKTQSLSDTKKANKSASFTDVMAKSMSGLLPISNVMNGGNKTSIDNVFVKTNVQMDLNKPSSTNDVKSDKVTKADVLKQNSSIKETSQDQKNSEVEICDYEENVNEEETVKKMMSEVVETIKKILGISDEEYQKAMSELGFTSVDLLEPNNIANLLAQVAGKQDAVSVITDSELSVKLKEIIQVVSDMMSSADSQYGINDQQFKSIVQTSAGDDVVQNQATESHADSLKEGAKQSGIQNDQVKSEEYVSEEHSNLEQVISEKMTTASSNNKNNNAFADHSNSKNKQNVFENGKANVNTNSDMNGVNVAAQLAKTFETAFANEFDVKPVDIVRQVVDSIKLQLNSQVKSMEIALNPENLGKVNLLVSVREGVVTAKFVAENEQVKKALEGQLNVLKENMSNQGLKVEAVEVTVQNNAFNGQENFNGNNPQQQTNNTKKHSSPLSFSEDDEVAENREETTINENSSVEFSA